MFGGYPRLDCPTYRESAPPEYLFAMITRGAEAFGGKKAMKPFQGVLDRREIADLVAYLQASPSPD